VGGGEVGGAWRSRAEVKVGVVTDIVSRDFLLFLDPPLPSRPLRLKFLRELLLETAFESAVE
jgi:hypothetical protein